MCHELCMIVVFTVQKKTSLIPWPSVCEGLGMRLLYYSRHQNTGDSYIIILFLNIIIRSLRLKCVCFCVLLAPPPSPRPLPELLLPFEQLLLLSSSLSQILLCSFSVPGYALSSTLTLSPSLPSPTPLSSLHQA